MRYSFRQSRHFNPLSPHGERQGHCGPDLRSPDFNPLSPHGERPTLPPIFSTKFAFQSTLPAWGETEARAAVEGSLKFQSTLPAWGETGRRFASWITAIISIHSPRMGRDAGRVNGCARCGDFNPLSPHGERRGQLPGYRPGQRFQSTLPAWGETK